jgi:hypothetical protein
MENKIAPYQEQAEKFAEIFITGVKGDSIKKESISNTQQMISSLIDMKYAYDEIKNELEKFEAESDVKLNLYVYFANMVIHLLEESTAKKRMASQRNISAAKMATRAQAKGGEKVKKSRSSKKKKPEEEKDEFGVKKMSLEDIGEEIQKKEEEDKKIKGMREETEKEVEEERQKHANAYQSAFSLYADYIALKGKEVKGINVLVEDVQRLGNSDLSIRQMAIDKIINNSNIYLAYYPLVASLKDKVIINKVVQALGKLGDFDIVPTLLNIFSENYGEKGAVVRGLSSQAIGNIISIFNSREKLLGTKKMFQIVKNEDFEKKLELMLPQIIKDIKSNHMRKYYYTDQCLRLLLLLSNKLIELKKKEVKAGFIKLKLQTPLSKMLKEASKEINGAIG